MTQPPQVQIPVRTPTPPAPPAAAQTPPAQRPAAAVQTPPEVKPGTPAAQTPPPPPTAGDPRFEALAAKERAFVADKSKFASEREALNKDREEYTNWKAAREARHRDPAAFLKQDFGDDWYERLTEYRLNGQKMTPELVNAAVEERLAERDRKAADERAKEAAAEKQRQDEEHVAAWTRFQADVTEFVKAKGDDYEFINLYGAHAGVVKLIEQTFAESGRILEAKEAADQVEKYLEEQVQKSLETKKWKARTPPPPVSASPAVGEVKRTESAQQRTLTSAQTPISTPPPPPSGDLSEDERIKRAIDAGNRAREARLAKAS